MVTRLLPDTESRRSALAIELVRIGVGIVWALNFIFVIAPANDYFGNFGTTARSFAPTSLGGPALADFVAAHATFFAWLIAVVTAYLAVAFILGLTTRIACVVGGIFSAVLLGVQVGSTYVFPGGTDVGEHPLYLLIYLVLVVGGAGSYYSLDSRIPAALARRRLARVTRPKPQPAAPVLGTLSYRVFVVYFIAALVLSFGVGAGLILALPPSASSGPGAQSYYYENLSINLNPSNGWPQYSPANFTVPTGTVVFTITDNDSPTNWSQCPCVVSGTVGDNELINGTPAHIVSQSNVAHTFNIPSLGLSTYSPGLSVVRFTVYLTNPGTFQWFCMAPCGAGSNPYQTPPMGTPGYMTGTMTIR
jgi:uncharacterized membrane protein YphA (DoxX/SURF4 family)